MRTQSFVLAILLGLAATLAGSRTTMGAWNHGTPGTACKMVYNSNNALVSGQTYQGTWITNNSSATNMQALCPVTLPWSTDDQDPEIGFAEVYGNSSLGTCYLGISETPTSYTFHVGVGNDNCNGYPGKCYRWNPYPGAEYSNAIIDCYMGAYSKLYEYTFVSYP